MRILLVGLNYAPEVAGIGPYTTELAEYLAGEGNQVTVLTGFPYYPQWRIDPKYERKSPFLVETINRVKVIRSPILLPGSRRSTVRRILFDSSLAVTGLMRSVGVGRIDAVICVSPPLQLGLTAWLIARSRGARFLLHLQDLVPDAALSVEMMRDGAALRIARRLESFVYSRADRISVISEGFLDNLIGKGVASRKLELIPNWVDTARFNTASDPAVRASLGATNGEMLVVHAGNMGAKQGLATVVEAAAELSDDGIVVTLVGDGNSRSELQTQAARLGLENLRFLPLQPDLPAILAAADVLVLAQRGRVVDSVAPSKLLSYMASGKPVVASVNEQSEAARMIHSAACGLVVEPDSPAVLASAIRQLRSQPEQGRRLGEAGRAYAAEHYERSRVLQRWSTYLEAIPTTQT